MLTSAIDSKRLNLDIHSLRDKSWG